MDLFAGQQTTSHNVAVENLTSQLYLGQVGINRGNLVSAGSGLLDSERCCRAIESMQSILQEQDIVVLELGAFSHLNRTTKRSNKQKTNIKCAPIQIRTVKGTSCLKAVSLLPDNNFGTRLTAFLSLLGFKAAHGIERQK
jgi:hypothetical protein